MSDIFTFDQIKIESPWDILHIKNLIIKTALNEHAECFFSALISEQSGKNAGQKETENDRIECYLEDKGFLRKTELIPLFKGFLKEVSVSVAGGLYTLEAVFLSDSVLLDRKEKSRSFQDISLNYADIASEILKDYADKSLEVKAPASKINLPVIQYRETDWQFLKRLASRQKTVIVPDAFGSSQILTFGYPTKTKLQKLKFKSVTAHQSGKNLAAYHLAHRYEAGLSANDYASFTIDTDQQLVIGDKVMFDNQEMFVAAVTIRMKEKESGLIYTAALVKETLLRQDPFANLSLRGATLKGKVLEVNGQTVKLELEIDTEAGKTQDAGRAYPFPFAPPTVDMMHLMPQVGTTAGLYIPEIEEVSPVVISMLRTNGATCANTADPNIRYLATESEHGQAMHEIKIAPEGIFITACNTKLAFSLDDNAGVTLSSHKKLVFNADAEITVETPKKIIFDAGSEIGLIAPNASISLATDAHFIGSQSTDFKKAASSSTTPRSLTTTQQEWVTDSAGSQIYNTPLETGALLDACQGKDHEFRGTCGLMSCTNVLRLAGVDAQGADVVAYAAANKLCTTGSVPGANGGTNYIDRQAVLQNYGGIASHPEQQTTANLRNAVSSGRGVIISVDTGKFYNNPRRLGSGHAVTVTSVKIDKYGNTEGFYVCDSNNKPASYYSAAHIQNSFTGSQMNVTNSVIR
ncbi:MAG: hypothetical protein LBR56_03590 [Sporomusaceae bacterium]|nr:hypothetical protein [Sporomusaceae bacterium]